MSNYDNAPVKKEHKKTYTEMNWTRVLEVWRLCWETIMLTENLLLKAILHFNKEKDGSK